MSTCNSSLRDKDANCEGKECRVCVRRPSSLRAQGSAYSPIRGAGSDAAAQVAYSGGSGGNSSGGSMTDGGSVGERWPHTHGPRVRLRALRAPHRLPPSPSLPFSPLLSSPSRFPETPYKAGPRRSAIGCLYARDGSVAGALFICRDR